MGSGQDSSGALNWETTYSYDGAGRLTNITQNGSNSSTPHTRTFVYDSLGRMTSETTPESGTTSFTYDANGNLLTKEDARSDTISYTYDDLNRVIKESFPSGTWGYTYDLSATGTGNAFQASYPIGRLVEASNDVNASEQYSYDTMGRIAIQANTLPNNCCSPITNELHVSYDLSGNVSSLTYPDGRTLSYSYDSADHLTGVQYTSWNGQSENAQYLSNTGFDPPGQITAASYGNGVSMAANFTSRQTVSALIYSKSGAIWSKQYTWANNGQNLLQIADEINSAQTYNYTYDPDNRLSSANGGGTIIISQATAGQGTVSFPGTEQSYQYRVVCGPGPTYCWETVWDTGTVSVTINGVNFSTQYTQGSTGSTIASALASNITANSTVVTATASGAGITIVAKTTGANTNYSLSAGSSTQDSSYFSSPSFSADASGSSLTGGANAVTSGADVINETYTIDAWGNLQKSGTFNFDQPFSSGNQIQASGYGYDAAGDLTSDGLGNTYQYDGAGNLVSSSGATYTYDANGERIEKTDGGNSTEYIYFNGEPVALLNTSTGAWTDLIWAENNMFAEVAGNQTAVPDYRLNDHLGSLAVLTDGSGNTLCSGVYTPFGEVMSSSCSDPYNYTGLESDNESNSDHAWARNLALAQSRWLRPDPYDGSYDLMNPQSFNRYSYVGNMPLEFTDQSGEDGGSACLIALEGGGEAGGVGIGVGAAVCALEALGAETITRDFWDWLFPGPTFHGSLTPRPGARTMVWDDTFGVPYSSPLSPAGLGNIIGLPSGTGGCDFGACGGGPMAFTDAATAPIGWCAEHPRICTAGADAAAFFRAIPAVTASAMLLSMEGDNSRVDETTLAACNARYEAEQDRCTARFGKGGRFGSNRAKGACLDRAFYRYQACVRGEPDPAGPMAKLQETPTKNKLDTSFLSGAMVPFKWETTGQEAQ